MEKLKANVKVRAVLASALASVAVPLLVLGLASCNSSGGLSLADGGTNAPSIVEAGPCQRDTRPEAQGMPSTSRIFSWIEDLVALGQRRTGTPAGMAASAYVKCQFEKLGLQEVHYEPVTSWKWQVTRHGLTVEGQAIESAPVLHSFITPDKPSVFSTGPDGLKAEIVDVNLGTPVEQNLLNVKGKIVLFDLKFLLPSAGLAPLMEFLWDPGATIVDQTVIVGNPYITTLATAVEAAIDGGAVGFIGVLADYFDSNQYYNEFYRRTNFTLPGLWVTKKEGARIRELMGKAQPAPTATLVLEGSREETLARTVVGMLPGKSQDTIMVQSHHDSVSNGAVEDGSGTASVLAQAQYFASQPAESREKTLLFATFDTHFTGYQSHQQFVAKYITNKETPYNIVANVTLEHIGKQGITGPDGKLEVVDQPELRGVMENLGPALKGTMIQSIIKHDLRRTALLNAHALCSTAGMPTDASFICTAGVPTASLIAGPNYLYDAADTLDKVHQEDLVPVAEVFSELIEAIDELPSALIGVPLPGPAVPL